MHLKQFILKSIHISEISYFFFNLFKLQRRLIHLKPLKTRAEIDKII
jgi:hypothetical protein